MAALPPDLEKASCFSKVFIQSPTLINNGQVWFRISHGPGHQSFMEVKGQGQKMNLSCSTNATSLAGQPINNELQQIFLGSSSAVRILECGETSEISGDALDSLIACGPAAVMKALDATDGLGKRRTNPISSIAHRTGAQTIIKQERARARAANWQQDSGCQGSISRSQGFTRYDASYDHKILAKITYR